MSDTPWTSLRPRCGATAIEGDYDAARRELLRRFDQLWRGEIGSVHLHSDRGSVFLTASPKALETKRLR